MKKNKLLLLVTLFLIPTIAFASSGIDYFPIGTAIFMEAFVSIHMTLFVLKPLSDIFGGDNPKKLLTILFITRVIVLLFVDFFITPAVAVLDFMAVFFGAFLIVPLCGIITGKKTFSSKKQYVNLSSNTNNTLNFVPNTEQNKINGIALKCNSCQSVVSVNDKFCLNCGLPLTGNNLKVEQDNNASVVVPPKVAVTPSKFDYIYSLSETKMLEEFLKRELTKAQIDLATKLIPDEALKKKKIFIVIFSILLFIYIGMIFFHFPLTTYIIGAIILFIFYKVTNNYNLIKYLAKEVKSRPNEKILNIIMNVKTSFVPDNSTKILRLGIIFAILLPAVIFIKPRIIYESIDGGYAVRYYAFGITNFTTVNIPEKHNGKDVVSLRGNAFSNMPFLKEAYLPDTIVEIRGEAFKNDIKLKSVKLPKNLQEIKGSSFENCSSLESITIPDSVTRIGGHAFYNNSSLTTVIITEKSNLQEIGSSAFRLCDKLYNITIPSFTYVNARAFKESPTDVKRYKDKENSYYNDDYYYSDYYQ